MKVALDTNIVLRLLLEDNKEQLNKARRIIKENNKDGDVFISSVVFLEMYFVLTKFYQWLDMDVFLAFDRILHVKQFFFENELAVRMAISRTKKGVDFSDALIGQIGSLRNIKTYTFDKKLKRDSAFIVI